MTKKNHKYKEVKSLDLTAIDKEVQQFWNDQDIFAQSISSRKDKENYVFYEGPPSANGMPGIHHVMARTVKDLFCRYKTLKGYKVERKGGWDTHGLPVELSVEKSLGITKEDIGEKISIAEYNDTCRKEVMKFKDSWDKLTRIMGYWVDLDDPYITFDNNYVETVWWLLKQLFDKGMLYKGYTVQPFSPGAGTGLSSHELNLPGCYREVKDTSVVAQFKVKDTDSEFLLAWTTTPWTLPSNTALAVGEKIMYLKIKTFNQYTDEPVTVYIAEELYRNYFNEKQGYTQAGEEHPISAHESGVRPIPFKIIGQISGAEMEGMEYEQILPYAQPENGNAFKVIIGNFVTTEDGTGIVHIAPSFGADDMKVAREKGIGALTMVDKQGKFVKEVTDFAGRYVKNYKDDPDYVSVDVDIAVKLKKENRAFNIEKFPHSYPHCWRTDKPIIYYPLNSWFVSTTKLKERMVELNKTINWQPEFTGTGRFGNWLENLVDWNLSRSRYWGTPLPVWVSEDETEIKCIGSIEELHTEIQKAIDAGVMKQSPFEEKLDLHRPYVDDVILVSDSGKKMFREPDLIDVWFDSGAMPYAQLHYPFENEHELQEKFPADFIAEGVDQTRGWFFTLHAIAVMLFDSVAYKNVVSNGLVLDKNGNKMSKRLGNAVDPFVTIEKYGADATRWYMISNSQPWDNLKFNLKGIEEVRRKFFGTLFNTYSFFSLYANIDNFIYEEAEVPVSERPEIDRWVISVLNSLAKEVDEHYQNYEPTKAARAIQSFVTDHLSNWYVRLCRRRFWKGEYSQDKIAAYQTLYRCMEVVAQLMSPVAPFFSDYLYQNLNGISQKQEASSVHLTYFPKADHNIIDKSLEERMQLAQDISSMVLSLRKKVEIKVRQPLNKILVPVLNDEFKKQVQRVEDLIKSEVNVKEVKYVEGTEGVIKKRIKPDFSKLGPKLGPKMKLVNQKVGNFSQSDIVAIETQNFYDLNLEGETVRILREEVEISTEDIPGWLVTNEGDITVALDINITEELKREGDAREFINKIQRLRKDRNFDVTDRIKLTVEKNNQFEPALKDFKDYICTEILAEDIAVSDQVSDGTTLDINNNSLKVSISVI